MNQSEVAHAVEVLLSLRYEAEVDTPPNHIEAIMRRTLDGEELEFEIDVDTVNNNVILQDILVYERSPDGVTQVKGRNVTSSYQTHPSVREFLTTLKRDIGLQV